MSFRWCWSCDAESRAIIGVFAAVAAIKLFLLAALGPISQPDTSGYVEYAEQILRSTTWLHDADLSSSPFIGLVDEKLAELRALPMEKQGRSFGLTEKRRRQVEAGLARDLPAVLRTDAPEFDLDGMLARFDRLWRK